MRKIFTGICITIGVLGCGIVLFMCLFAIDEKTGKSILGSTQTLKGTVTGVVCYGDTRDISFSVKGQSKSYYINHGMDKGLDCRALTDMLVGREAEISYVSPVTHINRLSYNGAVIYSELK
jgi:hypothetical protein